MALGLPFAHEELDSGLLGIEPLLEGRGIAVGTRRLSILLLAITLSLIRPPSLRNLLPRPLLRIHGTSAPRLDSSHRPRGRGDLGDAWPARRAAGHLLKPIGICVGLGALPLRLRRCASDLGAAFTPAFTSICSASRNDRPDCWLRRCAPRRARGGACVRALPRARAGGLSRRRQAGPRHTIRRCGVRGWRHAIGAPRQLGPQPPRADRPSRESARARRLPRAGCPAAEAPLAAGEIVLAALPAPPIALPHLARARRAPDPVLLPPACTPAAGRSAADGLEQLLLLAALLLQELEHVLHTRASAATVAVAIASAAAAAAAAAAPPAAAAHWRLGGVVAGNEARRRREPEEDARRPPLAPLAPVPSWL